MSASEITLSSNLGVVLASMRMRLITISRYKGQLLLDSFIPIVFAAMPILLGRASGGDDPGAAFEANTGTANYIAFMLIGSSVFSVVSNAFWHIANWLRWEMQTGTLEALYLAPTERVWVAGGTALYSMLRSIISALTAYFIGSFILGVNPLEGDLLLAMAFLLVGMLPLYGVTLLFGAVVLKVKEASALINVMQWLVSFLMGIFYPVTIFPPLMRAIALLFPPTWMTNGVRSALLGVGYFFGHWYLDLAMLWVFMFIAPLIGYRVFKKVENGVQRNEGIGQF
ncbi:MAG: ABC transporter permease [Anaerolineales bacterium]|nr:ABC transporter permease [Anaerolineales bacterium]